MTAVPLTVLSEREYGDTVLKGSITAAIDGPIAMECTLPAGFGDCYLRRGAVYALSIATMMSAPETFGPQWALVVIAGGATSDFLGGEYWRRSYTSRLLSVYDPLLAPLWRDGERLDVAADEVDTNAVPTVTSEIYLLVQRRRNMGAPVTGQDAGTYAEIGPALRFTS